ncbi:hypothetical protein PVAP13_3NG182696 [Panicum virgatum]|uniref:Uncharacterized protein n=1 Tax=Panicum virgatum TaxID=38727 RepID=A0A8T0UAA8_PANVG|nr:hypothetical protein PVAP13_3NG182696 [Panicum virgatum]
MGNSLPLPCVRHLEAEGTAAAKNWRKQKSRPACRRNVRAVVRPGHVVPVADSPPEDGDGGEEKEAVKEACRPGCRVEPAGCGGGVRRVRIVMRRKDIAELVARLEQRDAAERNANAAVMAAELSRTGLGGDGDGNDGGRGGIVTMSPCRDTWRPRLSVIPENY